MMRIAREWTERRGPGLCTLWGSMSTDAAERVIRRGGAVPWLLFGAVAAIACLPVLLSLPFISEPLGRDQAVYFTVVQSGGLPYDHVFDHKPPLIYGWYALSMVLSGGKPSVESVNLLAAVQLSASALAVAWVGLLLGGGVGAQIRQPLRPFGSWRESS